MRQPRFEIARTTSGFTARFIASNGATIFSTGSQVYPRRRGALRAINVLARAFGHIATNGQVLGLFDDLEIRDVDERGQR